MTRLLSLTSSLLILTQSNHVVNGFVSIAKSSNAAFRVADAVNGPLRVTTLDEWEAERAERGKGDAMQCESCVGCMCLCERETILDLLIRQHCIYVIGCI